MMGKGDACDRRKAIRQHQQSLTANLGFSVHFSKFFLRKLDAGPLTRCKIARHEGRNLQI